MGAVTILLAALLLCLTAYFEQWGHDLTTSSSVDTSAPAPNTEDPSYFEDKEIPRVFEEYATLHNSATASPMDAKYVLYEMPGNTTLAHSLFGLVRRAVITTITSSAVAPNYPQWSCPIGFSVTCTPIDFRLNTCWSTAVGVRYPDAPQSSMSWKCYVCRFIVYLART